ncbi:MAG: hypothetical protein PWR03_799 [Tenuifilum sp.]|jgi:hypothetical protein|uniref:hypothetical protein n=1 Tax=Tenuifilum sp. TaxID=2760880 RepID=UPI0024AB3137|nr:hypothetical protein [Tenuifilum sp.]MDI3526616.1 hypothetical protein [Tenuifilum sp.]
MKRTILVLSTLLLSTLALNAQDYKTGIGLRGGYPSGVTFKHFFAQKTAVEGILSFGWGGIGVTGLYQLHNSIPDAAGLRWYYGAGAHFATANPDKNNPFEGTSGSKVFLGADGVVGLEYTFNEAPINLSLDVMPILNIIESPGIWFNAGFSIRYTFK